MIYKEVTNTKNIDMFIESIKDFKIGKVPDNSFKKFSELEAFQIIITQNDKELLSLCIRGNKYISITEPDGSVSIYKVLNKSIDTDYLMSLYNSGI